MPRECFNGKVYLLNAPILTSYGVFHHYKANVNFVKNLLKNHEVISAIGHEATANFMSKILNYPIAVNRIKITMQHGDYAIVFRLLQRLPEGKVLSEQELQSIPYEITIIYQGCRDCLLRSLSFFFTTP